MMQAGFFYVMALTKQDFPFCLQNSTLFYNEWESLGDAVYCSLILELSEKWPDIPSSS